MLLQLSGVSKSFAAETVLSGIHLKVNGRDRIGLVGANGAGKSTLLKIIAQELAPDSGDIFRAKGARIGYLAQDSGLESRRTIHEEMREAYRELLQMEREMRRLEQLMASPGMPGNPKQGEQIMNRYASMAERFREQGGYEMEANIRAVIHGIGLGDIPLETRISTLSGGQKTRVALARLLLEAPDLLILDEPTNHLDIPALTWLESWLKNYRGALIIVSHDRYFLDEIVDAIFEIERTKGKRYTGNYSRYVELKTAETEQAVKQYEQQQEKIARMEDFIRRNIARASTSKRAQSRRKALEKMERLDKPVVQTRPTRFSFEIERPSGKDVLRVKGLGKSYPGRGLLFSGIDFQLKRGEAVAIIGPNGAGKSTLLKILLGRVPADNGSVQWGTNVKIGYYDQEQSDLNPQNTVLDELWNAYPHLEETRVRTVLGHFLFSGEDVKKKVMTLSGGEKARLALAKLMLRQANVLILDEPTNHLDLAGKEMLENALLHFEGTLLFISHDRYFLNRIADAIIELSGGGMQYFLGNYDDYVEKKRELAERKRLSAAQPLQAARPETGQTKTSAAHAHEKEKGAKRLERQLQRQLERLEADIARLEQRIAECEQTLADPEHAKNYVLLQEWTKKMEQYKAELDAALEQWEKLMLSLS